MKKLPLEYQMVTKTFVKPTCNSSDRHDSCDSIDSSEISKSSDSSDRSDSSDQKTFFFHNSFLHQQQQSQKTFIHKKKSPKNLQKSQYVAKKKPKM